MTALSNIILTKIYNHEIKKTLLLPKCNFSPQGVTGDRGILSIQLCMWEHGEGSCDWPPGDKACCRWLAFTSKSLLKGQRQQVMMVQD